MSTFDYIIVGAGTSGCVLASRLTENPDINVLLIEAGGPGSESLVRTPLGFPRLFRTDRDWSFWTEPQPELADRRLFWPRGKMLGGSGSMNAMVHTDACRADLDAWATEGCTGWGFEDLREILDLVGTTPAVADPLSELNPLSQAFLEACSDSGLPRASYLRDARQPASGPFRVNIKDGKRWGAREAYLDTALKRANLTVWSRVTVMRVLLEQARAVGVAYLHQGSLQRVSASREVILCAGAIGSPHLLMLSGIGPEAHLADHAIPVQVPLEGVGTNLQDHLAAPVSYFSKLPVSLSGSATNWNQLRHSLRGKGPLASNGAEAGAFLQSQAAQTMSPNTRNAQQSEQQEPCDLELLFAPVHFVDHGFAKPGGHGFSVIPILLTPRSRGTVRLLSADPREAPLIDPRYLSDHTDHTDPMQMTLDEALNSSETEENDQPEINSATPSPIAFRKGDLSDLARLTEGVEAARKLVQNPAFASFLGASVQGDLPTEDHIRTWGQTLYHPAGTCRMGTFGVASPLPDPVVDPALRVYGVVGLRVADASIMPRIPRAHLNATVMVIAEKAARLLLGS